MEPNNTMQTFKYGEAPPLLIQRHQLTKYYVNSGDLIASSSYHCCFGSAFSFSLQHSIEKLHLDSSSGISLLQKSYQTKTIFIIRLAQTNTKYNTF
mmetsp:Transcript_38807/g.71161  ORF Transcript_38807/g.71161 Transcript_38807/m.71161 type:complete len:96 (-) Transcript_38807:308-595(-)